jgi:radical SAM-linked protein
MRYRVRWGKTGKLRYLSHHDIATVFERSFRRAKLPIAYSQGFSAHPKIAFGSGLPVGYGSEVELLDLELEVDMEPEALCESLNRFLPAGLSAISATRLVSKGTSLGEMIRAADYRVDAGTSWLAETLMAFMELESYSFSRPYKGAMREDDLRRGVLDARVDDLGFTMRCAIKPRSTRPADVIKALSDIAGQPVPPVTVTRTDLLTDSPDGLVSLLDQTDPIPVGAAQ